MRDHRRDGPRRLHGAPDGGPADGALLLASSCILGFQVTHGARVAKAVRERFPDLPIIWGGWFPSVVPELYLQEGIADAVGLGQGELTFGDVRPRD